MSSRNLFASVMACLLVVGFPLIAPVANAGSVAQSSLKAEKISGKKPARAKVKRPGRRVRIHLPVGPGYVYYDYPYYYSRGYYPRHIGGYVYYPYYYYRSKYWGHHRGSRSHRR